MVSPAEKEFEKALRPLKFSDFSGQNGVVENLEVFVEAAKYRGEPLDHTLLHGPPGKLIIMLPVPLDWEAALSPAIPMAFMA